MKTTVSTIAILLATAGAANAACNVSGNIISFTINGNSLTETDCASAATVATQGTQITTIQGNVTTLQGTVTTQGGQISTLQGQVGALTTTTGLQGTAITNLQTENATQAGQISSLQTNKADKSYVDSQNAAQNTLIIGNYVIDAVQQGQINTATTKNNQQDGRLNSHDTQLAAHQSTLDGHTSQIGELQTVTTEQGLRLDAHDAALASHQAQINKLSGKLDEAFEGIAMAIAMESPQVDPGKRFGIALNWGNFEGENAFAAAAKLRFNDNWAATGGVGFGTGQSTLGVRAGIQAQW